MAEKKLSKKARLALFIDETSHELAKEECARYVSEFEPKVAGYVQSTWKYFMGAIGSCNWTYSGPGENARSKAFDKHPDWRPLGHYSFYTRGWMGESVKVEGWVQDWQSMLKISDTDSFTITLYKHPHQ